jgi:AcrR family transcriptional regulator
MPLQKAGHKLAGAALKLLAKKSWRQLTLSDVAKAAKVPLTQLQPLDGGKQALIGLILDKFGADTGKHYSPGGVTERDRVFDAAMAWFDVLAPHKRAIGSLYDGLKFDSLTLLALRRDFIRAANWLLTLAAADTGSFASARALGFAIILGRAIPAWLNDDKDLTKTMAQIDGDLNRAEDIAKFVRPRSEA